MITKSELSFLKNVEDYLSEGIHIYPKAIDNNNKRLFNIAKYLEEKELIYRAIDRKENIYYKLTDKGRKLRDEHKRPMDDSNISI